MVSKCNTEQSIVETAISRVGRLPVYRDGADAQYMQWAIPVNKGTPPLRTDNYVLGGGGGGVF